MSDEKLTQALRQLAEAQGARLRQQARPDRRTPACPSLPRLWRALLRDDWNDAERAHRATGCPYCAKTEAQMRETIWHPSIHQLLAHVQQQLSGDESLDVHHH